MKAQVVEYAPVQPARYFEAAERRPNKEIVLLSIADFKGPRGIWDAPAVEFSGLQRGCGAGPPIPNRF
jgi:hypothetical protein